MADTRRALVEAATEAFAEHGVRIRAQPGS